MKQYPVWNIDGHMCQDTEMTYYVDSAHDKWCYLFIIDGLKYASVQATTYEDCLAGRDGYHYFCIDNNANSLSDLEVYDLFSKYRRRYLAQ